MTVFSFRDLTLREAEQQLAHRCLTDRTLLQAALETLPRDCWRSERGEDLARVFYVLAGWLERGAYDPETNEVRICEGLAALHRGDAAMGETSWWTAYVDTWWSPSLAVEAYSRALLDAVATAYRQADDYEAAYRRFLEERPIAVDTFLEDCVYERLREAILRRRLERFRPTSKDPDSVPPRPLRQAPPGRNPPRPPTPEPTTIGAFKR